MVSVDHCLFFEKFTANIVYKDRAVKNSEFIETKIYKINGFQVRFSCELIPSDMKWLATYSRELNNAAYYFSSFANVNQDNMRKVNGSGGHEPTNTWKPWVYSDRLKVSEEVSIKREELAKPRGGKPAYMLYPPSAVSS